MHLQRKNKRRAFVATLALGAVLAGTYSLNIFPFKGLQQNQASSDGFELEILTEISTQMPNSDAKQNALGNAVAVKDFSKKAGEVQEMLSVKNENKEEDSLFSSLSTSFSNVADLDYFEDNNEGKLIPMQAPSFESVEKAHSLELAKANSEPKKNPNAQISLSGYEVKENEVIVRKEVVKGDTIGSILEDYITRKQLYSAIDMAKPIRNLETVRIGQSYEIVLDNENNFIRYEYEVDSEETFVLLATLIKPEIDTTLAQSAENIANVDIEQSAQKLIDEKTLTANPESFSLEIDNTIASVEEVTLDELDIVENQTNAEATSEAQMSEEAKTALVQTAQNLNDEVAQEEKEIVREYTFNCELVPVVYDIQLVTIEGDIQESLSAAIAAANEGYSLSYSIARIFADKIDFFSDIHKGDSFKLLVEKKYKDGKFVKYGKTLAAFFVNKKREYTAFRFENDKGHSAYFDANGHSLQGLLLKSPLDYTRISSGYTMNRRHPILGIVRPHQGIDYAAPSGTPIVSIGDGTVTFVGWKGGYGKTIIVRHTNGLESQYAHMRGYAKVSKKGAKVSKGQTIGYVGSTGLSTGPHLDFRIKQNGKFVNPSSVVSEAVPPLKGNEKDSFLLVMDKINEYLNGTKALTSYNPDASLQDSGS